jgi:hypothetical protein
MAAGVDNMAAMVSAALNLRREFFEQPGAGNLRFSERRAARSAQSTKVCTGKPATSVRMKKTAPDKGNCASSAALRPWRAVVM